MIDDCSEESTTCARSCCQLMMTKYAHLLEQMNDPLTQSESIQQSTVKDMHPHNDKGGKHSAQEGAIDKESVVGTRGVLEVPHHLLDEVVEPHTERESTGQPTTKDMNPHEKKGGKHSAQEGAIDKEIVVRARGVLKLSRYLLDEVDQPHTERESTGQPTTKDMNPHEKKSHRVHFGDLDIIYYIENSNEEAGGPIPKRQISTDKKARGQAKEEVLSDVTPIQSKPRPEMKSKGTDMKDFIYYLLMSEISDESSAKKNESPVQEEREEIRGNEFEDIFIDSNESFSKSERQNLNSNSVECSYQLDNADRASAPVASSPIQEESSVEMPCDVQSRGTQTIEGLEKLPQQVSGAILKYSTPTEETEQIRGNEFKDILNDSSETFSKSQRQNLNSNSVECPYQLDNADRASATGDSSARQEESPVEIPCDVLYGGTLITNSPASVAVQECSATAVESQQVQLEGMQQTSSDETKTTSKPRRQRVKRKTRDVDNAHTSSTSIESLATQEESSVQGETQLVQWEDPQWYHTDNPHMSCSNESVARLDRQEDIPMQLQYVQYEESEFTYIPDQSAHQACGCISGYHLSMIPCDVLYGGTLITNSPASVAVQECSATAVESQQVQLEGMQQTSSDETKTTSKPRRQRVKRKTRDVDNAHTSSTSIESLATQEESSVQGETQLVQWEDPQWYHTDNPHMSCSNESVARLDRQEDIPMQLQYVQYEESEFTYIPDQSAHQACGCISGYHLSMDEIQLAQGGDMQHVNSELSSIQWHVRTRAGDHAYQGDDFDRSDPSVSFEPLAAQEDSSVELQYVQYEESEFTYIPDQSAHQACGCIPGYHLSTDKIELAQVGNMQQVLSDCVEISPQSSCRRCDEGTRPRDQTCQGDKFVRSSPSVSFEPLAAQEDSSVELQCVQYEESEFTYIPDQSAHQACGCIPGYHLSTDKIELAQVGNMQQVLSDCVEISPQSSSRQYDDGTRPGDQACQEDNFVRSRSSKRFQKTQKTKIFTNSQRTNRFSSENSDLSEEESHSKEQSQYQKHASCDEYSHSTEQSPPYSVNIRCASTQTVSPRPSSNYTDNVYPHNYVHHQEPPSSVCRNQLPYNTNNQIQQSPSTDGYSYNISSVGEHRENNKQHMHYARLCPRCKKNYINVVINKCRVCNYHPNIVAADQFPGGVHLPEYFYVNCRFTRFNEMGERF